MLLEFLNQSQSDRLLKVIEGKYPEIPYNKLQSLLRKKDIRVNGKKVSDNIVVETNDMVQLYIASLEDERKNRNINIFYNDENILIAEKPQDLEVEGAPSLTQLLSENESYLRACHRLDRNTTGLVVFAKSEKSYSQMYKAFSQRTVDKHYLALICGYLEEPQGTLEAFLFKDSKKSRVYISDTAGKGYAPVSLEYREIERFSDLCLVEIKLITGRTHQIRAQFAHIDHPVLGDGKYGKSEWNKRFDVKNQQLYAYKLKFNFEEQSSLAYLNDMDFANSLYLSDLREFNPDYDHGGISPVIKNYDMGKQVDDDSFPPYQQLLSAMEVARQKQEEELQKLTDVPHYKSGKDNSGVSADTAGNDNNPDSKQRAAADGENAQRQPQDNRPFTKNRRRRKKKNNRPDYGDKPVADNQPRTAQQPQSGSRGGQPQRPQQEGSSGGNNAARRADGGNPRRRPGSYDFKNKTANSGSFDANRSANRSGDGTRTANRAANSDGARTVNRSANRPDGGARTANRDNSTPGGDNRRESAGGTAARKPFDKNNRRPRSKKPPNADNNSPG